MELKQPGRYAAPREVAVRTVTDQTLARFLMFVAPVALACSTGPQRIDSVPLPDANPPEDKTDTSPPDNLTGVDRFRQIAMTQGMAISHVRDLTSTVGARSAGSAGDAKAVAWALERMNAIGLQNVRAEAVTVPHWERGEEHAELLGASEQKLTVAALGGSVATPPEGVEAEILAVSSVAMLDAIPADQVSGKIVFFNGATERTMDASGYSRAVGARNGGAAAAARKGAVASIVRSISTSMSNFPHTGTMSSAAIPAAAISVADALVLDAALANGPVRVRLTLGSRKLADEQSANVIGEVVGRERPEEVVLLGAHLDSWDLATGALDDGAGVAMVLETGRLLVAHAPEGMLRTVRIVLFANEEAGLSGANAYPRAHQAELANHVMAVEADLGDGRVYGVSFQASSAADTLRNLLSPLEPLGIAPAMPGSGAGADIGPLRRAGVPVAELQQDLTRYFDYHHSGDDVFERVDAASLTQATAAMAVFAYQLGRSTAPLGRASGELLPAHEH